MKKGGNYEQEISKQQRMRGIWYVLNAITMKNAMLLSKCPCMRGEGWVSMQGNEIIHVSQNDDEGDVTLRK